MTCARRSAFSASISARSLIACSQRLGLALGVVEELAVDAPRLPHARRAERLDREQDEGRSGGDSRDNCEPDVHVRRTSLGWVHPIRHCARSADRRKSSLLTPARSRTRRQTAALPRRRPTSHCALQVRSHGLCVMLK
jgi:hypothetical protein